MNDDIEKIAVVGMSGAFPGAPDIDSLWELLISKREGISTLTKEELIEAGENPALLDDPSYIPRGGFLDDAEYFDNDFFGISPGEALAMDPQQRLFLQHARLALDDAGFTGDKANFPVGVFAGESPTQYWFLLRNGPYTKNLDDFRLMLGNEKDYIATRVSYKLNLKGPSLNVQSACSTSMSAIALACQSLLTWGCDLAIAGGVSVSAPRKLGYVAYEGMIVSPTGACRPFDAAADGTLFGEGVGVVCLKRFSEALNDGDYIYAVVEGVGMSNDGSDKVGFTAPSAAGQAEAIELAQAIAGINPEDIGFVEAHGSATPLGDPIEVHALTQAFRRGTSAVGYCRLGSIKSNIGHLDSAAGVASFIKTVLAVNKGIIPPTLHYANPNPHLELEGSPFVVNTEPVLWSLKNGKRFAGVSSTGIGGTNVHAVISSPPFVMQSVQQTYDSYASSLPCSLLLSGKTAQSVSDFAAKAADFLARHPEVNAESLAAKIRQCSTEYPYRKGFAIRDRSLLIQDLSKSTEDIEPASKRPVVFAFPGQGSQFPAMARSYYGTLPVFTELIDRGIYEATKYGCPELKKFLLEDEHCEAEIARTETTQPILYIIEYALAKELIQRGVIPDLLVGHSIGEYAAAAISGIFSFEEGLRLVIMRGRLMQQAAEGAMVAVALPEQDAHRFAKDGIYISVINTTAQTVLSGNFTAIEKLETDLSGEGIKFTRLKTSHAFHSPYMDEILDSYRSEVRKTLFERGSIRMLSNIDGTVLDSGVDWTEYWVRQLRQPVRFNDCTASIYNRGDAHVIETGPGRSLTGFLKTDYPEKEDVFSLLPNARADSMYFERSLIRFWERGIAITLPKTTPVNDSPVLFSGYPFAKKRFWPTSISEPAFPVSKNNELEDSNGINSKIHDDQNIQSKKVRAIWKSILGHEDFTDQTNFFLCGGDSFAGIQLLQKLKSIMNIDLKMSELMGNPTIDAISLKLTVQEHSPLSNEDISNPKTKYLFPIQTKGDKPPLFMVAGAHRNRFLGSAENQNSYEEDFYRYFSILMPTLGLDQPLYGFRPKGIDNTEPLHSSVPIMAEMYVQAMKGIQPEGPYYIGGECVGGIVAQEMTRQLEEKGERVAKLFLLDTPRPGPGTAFLVSVNDRRYYLYRSIVDTLKLFFRGQFHQIASEARNKLFILSVIFFPITKKRRLMRRNLYGSKKYEHTLLSHRANPSLSPVIYIINRVWNSQKFMMGWKRELGQNIRVFEVPGYHHNRLKISGKLIGEILRKEIQQGH